MRQKFVRIQISHQEILRKMPTFSQVFLISVLITRFISLNLHQSLNWQISLLSLKMVTEILRKTIGEILSNTSKIFERYMFGEISSFTDSYLSKQQCGFAKDYNP